MNKFTLKFEFIDGDAISVDWETDENLEELNIHIAKFLSVNPWYTIIENKATNINMSHVKYYTITSK